MQFLFVIYWWVLIPDPIVGLQISGVALPIA
jgi:hypothetical protein